MAKYKVGDEVTVRGIVVGQMRRVGPIVEFGRQNEFHSAISFTVPIEEIATHTPKPREFMVGDKVRPRSDGLTYELVGIRDEYAFLWNSRNKYARVVEERILFHVDEAEQ